VTTVAIIGGGGHAMVVASMLAALPDVTIIGYTDLVDRGVIENAAYVGTDSALRGLRERFRDLELALGVGHLGDITVRTDIVARLTQEGFHFRAVVSQRAAVAPSAFIGPGVVIMPGVVVNAGARLGRYAIVNSNATIEHGCMIGEHTHVAPGAVVCGDTRIGSGCLIGAGAIITQGIEIGADCLVGAGAVVTRSAADPGVYIGCPARRIR
jgi:UDP-perosamine 4-acetyltransferase